MKGKLVYIADVDASERGHRHNCFASELLKNEQPELVSELHRMQRVGQEHTSTHADSFRRLVLPPERSKKFDNTPKLNYGSPTRARPLVLDQQSSEVELL